MCDLNSSVCGIRRILNFIVLFALKARWTFARWEGNQMSPLIALIVARRARIWLQKVRVCLKTIASRLAADFSLCVLYSSEFKLTLCLLCPFSTNKQRARGSVLNYFQIQQSIWRRWCFDRACPDRMKEIDKLREGSENWHISLPLRKFNKRIQNTVLFCPKKRQ